MMRSSALAAAVVLLGATVLAHAQMPGSKVATVTASAKPAKVARGGSGTLTLTVAVAPGFHINANKPASEYLIPTAFQGTATAGVKFGAPRYPGAKSIDVSYEKKPLLVYDGKFVIQVPFTVAKTAKPGPTRLNGTLHYQACNDTSCYPPSSAAFKAPVVIR